MEAIENSKAIVLLMESIKMLRGKKNIHLLWSTNIKRNLLLWSMYHFAYLLPLINATVDSSNNCRFFTIFILKKLRDKHMSRLRQAHANLRMFAALQTTIGENGLMQTTLHKVSLQSRK